MIPTLAKTLSKIAFLPCTHHLGTEAAMKGAPQPETLRGQPSTPQATSLADPQGADPGCRGCWGLQTGPVGCGSEIP